ncbi:magnesium transporter NIPA-domain-containing protein [Amylostereum chailletii]|nr:magnesium transporter NIPA-domain-containing protein [Amylostereum chailletii]
MLEDKYIGLALAISSSLAIGTSFIITKKGLNDAAERGSAYANASDDHAYLKNPIWWAGMATMANFAAYSFAPPILVTPLGALSVIIGAILASYLLDEELGHLGRVGCTMCLIGSLIIILHAPADKDIQTVDEILHYAIQPGFLMYCFSVLVFTLVMVYHVSPRYGRTNPLVYVSICSLVGSVSIMAIKGFGIAVKLTIGGNNQFTHPSTYVFGIIVAVCILTQMNYFNKALDTFSTNVVNPMYYVCFSTATIVASLILFQGFNTDNPTNTVSLLIGFVVTFLGIHLLELSRKPEALSAAANAHGPLEGGLMNPRLSLQGRPSLDGWGAPPSPAPNGHARRGSRTPLYRAQTATLFNAFEDEDADGHAETVGLRRLSEEGEDDELEAATERTRLRAEERRSGSRSHSHSVSPKGSQSDLRRS